MKTIGLIGGMSWESSAVYYNIINQTVRERLHPLANAKSVMVTVNFKDIETMQRHGQWQEAASVLVRAAQQLERAGADCVVLCTNTMHKVAHEIEASIRIPFLHIADPTAQAIKTQGLRRVGLLGTAFTMEQDFYKNRLVQHGLEVVLPEAEDRRVVHRVIYEELVAGVVNPASKLEYVRVMDALVQKGAEGIILGCTEIMLLVGQADANVPIFDTTTLHAVGAVDFALQQGNTPK